MWTFRDTPLRRKLTLIILLTSCTALLLACAAFVAFDILTFRGAMTRDLSTLAKVIGANCTAALSFEDPKVADETLAALKAEPHVVFACVFTKDGRQFSKFVRQDFAADFQWPAVLAENHRFANGYLDLSRPIVLNDESIGTIYLRSDLRELTMRARRYVYIVVFVILVSSLVALALSSRLQRLVTDPILRLARIAQVVTLQKDYSIRAEKHSRDETGTLIDAFNEMLTQIHQRDDALRRANDELEHRVQERTHALQEELSERKRAEDRLKRSEAQLAQAQHIAHLGSWEWDIVANKVTWSEEMYRIFGLTPETFAATYEGYLSLVGSEDRQRVDQAVREALRSRQSFFFYHRLSLPNKTEKIIHAVGENILDEHGTPIKMVGTAQDVTESKRAEQALHESEEMLRQAQKMEAIGRLAGGVAHDFNNILTVINGYSELLSRQTDLPVNVQKQLTEINQSGQRAAGLTRQLLAFSRKQVLQPKILDLNEVVHGMEKMLRRLIGEDIELRTVFAPASPKVKADPGQLEQVILNLAVNARDAMPRGGKLMIETATVVLDQKSSYRDRNLEPGEYITLAVRDTGVGMTDAVKSHLFEPFFTTKGPGKGTGLGLATCYGIIRQSDGDIRVYSEINHGTVFKIYLPRATESVATHTAPQVDDELPTGNETILIVEDESSVRELAALILRGCGYNVLEAVNGLDGLRVAAEMKARSIDLVICDIIMPKLGGKDMADRLRQTRADAKVLFISGYTDDALANHGVLDPEVAFLEKPFSAIRLAQTVRQILDQPQPATVNG